MSTQFAGIEYNKNKSSKFFNRIIKAHLNSTIIKPYFKAMVVRLKYGEIKSFLCFRKLKKFYKIFTHMNAVAFEKKDEVVQENLGELKKVSIFLSGLCKKDINRCAREFYEFISSFVADVNLPYILPLSEAVYTVRKSPCGNGTTTFSRFRLRIHQRRFDLSLYDSQVSRAIEFLKNSPVDAQLKMNF